MKKSTSPKEHLRSNDEGVVFILLHPLFYSFPVGRSGVPPSEKPVAEHHAQS